MNKNYDYVIVGTGLSGSVIANILANKGKKILILEKREHIGGNVYDEYSESTGVLVQKYGPHIFHTNNEIVWNFVSSIVEWVPFEMKCGAYIKDICSPSPFNFKTIDLFFKEKAGVIKEELKKEYPNRETVTIIELLKSNNIIIKEYADFLFKEDYSLYTAKQWGIPPEKVDIDVLKRVPVRLDYEEKYFTDKYQYMPKNGFSDFIVKLLKNENIKIEKNIDATSIIEFDDKYIKLKRSDCLNARIIWTGAVDQLFNYCFGLLPYRSLSFEYKIIDSPNYQNYPVVAYPKAIGYTRITDYNQLPIQKKDKTVIALEYPKQYTIDSFCDPYYPINNLENNDLYKKYFEESKKYKNLFLIGRLANYKYFNMDQVIFNALELCKELE